MNPLEHNMALMMRDGPRLRTNYHQWIIARDREVGKVVIGGIGAMGIGAVWSSEEGNEHYLGFHEAPEATGNHRWKKGDWPDWAHGMGPPDDGTVDVNALALYLVRSWAREDNWSERLPRPRSLDWKPIYEVQRIEGGWNLKRRGIPWSETFATKRDAVMVGKALVAAHQQVFSRQAFLRERIKKGFRTIAVGPNN